MQASRDDFVIAIRSAFLKKENKQKFSLFALIFLTFLILVLEKFNLKPIDYLKISLREVAYRSTFIVSIPENLIKKTYLATKNHFKVYEETLPNGAKYLIQERFDDDSYDNTAVFQVPDGHYFMMGDNRDNSRDSRTTAVGMVPAENLVGRADRLFFSHNGKARIWEFWKWPFAIRYGRIGDSII